MKVYIETDKPTSIFNKRTINNVCKIYWNTRAYYWGIIEVEEVVTPTTNGTLFKEHIINPLVDGNITKFIVRTESYIENWFEKPSNENN